MLEEIRDTRRKQYFLMDDEYLNGYARLLRQSSTLVYLSLCRHVNKEQQAWPGIELICKEFNISKSTVIRAIKELEEWNIISVLREKDEFNKQKVNIYTLLDKSFWKEKPGVMGELGSKAGCHGGTEPGVICDPLPGVMGEQEGYTVEGNTMKATQDISLSPHNLFKNSSLEDPWNNYLLMRKSMRKPATKRAQELLLKELEKLSSGDTDTAIKILEQSIMRSWLKFYPLKEEPIQLTPEQKEETLAYEIVRKHGEGDTALFRFCSALTPSFNSTTPEEYKKAVDEANRAAMRQIDILKF